MNECMKLIVVEDEDDMFETYEDTARDKSTDSIRIELIRHKSAGGAKEALLKKGFDGAIVDLNLEPTVASGNEVLKEIVGQHRFPVFVVSGNLHNLDPDIAEKKSGFLKFFDRDVSNEKIFDELIDIFNTGITKILGGRGKIEKHLDAIFWSHLANDFGIWFAGEGKGGNERTLLRYAVSHLAEYLDVPDGEDRFYHEAEFYIKPPIKKYVACGDILELGGERYINLSPACDVEVRAVDEEVPLINADRIMLGRLIKVDRASFIEAGLIGAEDNGSRRESVLDSIIKGKRDRFSFLPSYGDIPPSVIDFQNIQAHPFREVLDAHRVATVAGIFLKDIQSRLSAYYGRQGQPDLDRKQLVKEYKKLLSSS